MENQTIDIKTDKRESFLDGLRGQLVLIMLLGHSNLFFNSLRPKFSSEGVNGLMDPWQDSLQGTVRIIIHCVAFAFFTISGFTTEHHLKKKKNIWLIKNGLIVFFTDVIILSVGWVFPHVFVNGHFFLVFEALGAIGLCLCCGAFLRKLSTQTLLLIMLTSFSASYFVNQYVFLPYDKGLVFDFIFTPSKTNNYIIFYSLSSWISIYIFGMLSSRFLTNEKLKKQTELVKNNLFIFSTILFMLFLIIRFILTDSFKLISLFQLRLYPPSASYILLSISWLGFVICLYKFLIHFQDISVLLNFCGRHARLLYIVHPYIYGTINFFLLLNPGQGRLQHAVGFWSAGVFGLYLLVNYKKQKIE